MKLHTFLILILCIVFGACNNSNSKTTQITSEEENQEKTPSLLAYGNVPVSIIMAKMAK
ncbi:hypothetical protein [Jejuia pallidilutea]|uniref:Uncharacterized protein n=1 Tax=Jejuia pallidilutea TaxID=504487 RepID=A0A090WLL5_9FLAO|nr:hypothetical protein [Jejuia pallidilutea]GAL68357.1 hypothetical protein JCM19301_1964 [Jejuia pallidilutea]GAL73333.1 hypothetical protein JCM19302_399 [Jejuia pallidilutea]